MDWGNRIPRICTWARFVGREDGVRFYVYNVHLDHESQASRQRSVELLARRIRSRSHGDAVVLTGDFNAGETNPVIRFFSRDEVGARLDLVDTFRELHPDARLVGTFNGFRGDNDGEKIDYVFATSDIRVLDATIVRDHASGRFPSDHYPVYARLQLPPPRDPSP
jgi:endonuclease/exonuclease/phosphatase family metal-dependent hydrolase